MTQSAATSQCTTAFPDPMKRSCDVQALRPVCLRWQDEAGIPLYHLCSTQGQPKRLAGKVITADTCNDECRRPTSRVRRVQSQHPEPCCYRLIIQGTEQAGKCNHVDHTPVLMNQCRHNRMDSKVLPHQPCTAVLTKVSPANELSSGTNRT